MRILKSMLKLVVYNIEHGGEVYVPVTDTIELIGFSFVGNQEMLRAEAMSHPF
jgi:hypothetical protein